ncbi:pirin family protein [Shimwellia blattae]|uniref:Pirin family protein n=1 Tax=Shimwellia blattae (strain ATCC 29907 / DSM 4481 / JCM 1650 / NBRC 105725 / CDC 9005-74) TaxID=630626 RepID=I2B9P3_SHIBC|nr:pirin family protein [Shimwellia blattae]AFJ47247.1 pirin family protein [Shimwellia blattae DSM 4481 = NBRC 105725]GAB82224.1 pirin family protein [Shimwellia blattae DSM 4481 = NBRC 105725]VDY64740.1 Quercetin 2,3-dioxygenase [Shimwellia blattae]VEC22839.1 Quercetin 2,3-dioxygenase [Shimwellia blattae]
MKKVAFIKRSNGRHWVGNGFPVMNIFSYRDNPEAMSPFLLLDYAGPTTFSPTGEKRGVGQHPHRGFETVTIVYAGGVSHRDSSGGGGTIGPGDVQWMTAASGVIHEEYHSPEFARQGGAFEMVQLWVNLPARHKMAAPGYQGITAETIPDIPLPDGAGQVRVIAGEYSGIRGPARTMTPMNVWDLQLLAGHQVTIMLPPGHTTALFVLHGELQTDGQPVGSAELAVMSRAGEHLVLEASKETRLLLLSGEPLNEPVVGHGPFVMNTREEISQAIRDFTRGQFGQIQPDNSTENN